MGQIQRQIAESRRNACNCSGHKMRPPSCFAFGSLAKCFLDSDAFLTNTIMSIPFRTMTLIIQMLYQGCIGQPQTALSMKVIQQKRLDSSLRLYT